MVIQIQVFDEQGAAAFLGAWKEWLERQPLEELFPREKVKGFIRRAAEEEVLARDVLPRVERAFDAALERLRKLDRSTADLLGPAITGRIVEAVGDAEPDDAAVHAFFEERAVAELLSAVLYDGITEFIRKANQLSDLLPGVQAAKKLAGGVGGLLGGLAGGLAGSLAGGMREELEKKLEGQVRGFLTGFSKIATERAARFATAPANKKVFREMRQNLARKALERPVKDLVARLDAARAAQLRHQLRDAVAQALREERTTHRLEAEVDRLSAEHGQSTIASVTTRYLGDVPSTELVAKILAPTLSKFPPTEGARAAIADAWRRIQGGFQGG